MARLLRHLDDELYVQYGALCIYGTPDIPELRDEESEALHYTAALHLEAWDAEPPDPGTSWRLIEQRNFTAETGVIQIGVVDDSGREFLTGPPLFEYGLTVHVDVPDDGRWLFRFWPIRDVFDPLVHMKPREPIGSSSPLGPRAVPVPRHDSRTVGGHAAGQVPTFGRRRAVGGHAAGTSLGGSGRRRVEPR
ncbi:hypothetical protein ACFYOK_34810 [Microbispora bryophytorum]|uniref:hypothetical protein n=1 Tax=Microbispora bryophytorum TaxID=1460882 RepID=UPI00340CA0B2